MAARKIDSLGDTARQIREHPVVARLLEDPELRAQIRSAYMSGRSAYGRMNNGKGPTKALLEDKKLQKDLREAANSLREVSEGLRAPRRRRRRPFLRLVLLSIAGGIAALALSEGLRSKLLDLLFGAEEEFDYTSTTTPPPPPDPSTAATVTNHETVSAEAAQADESDASDSEPAAASN